jgi:hypothetical protein
MSSGGKGVIMESGEIKNRKNFALSASKKKPDT